MEWFNKLMESVGQFIPHLAIVRSTHGGVKFKHGKKALSMAPGIHFYWPLVTEIEVYPTIRQTCNLENQTLTTLDNKIIGLSGIVVYRVFNVFKFLTEAYDGEDTVRDIVLSTISNYVETHNLEEIRANFADIRKNVRQDLRQFGIRVVKVALSHNVECKFVIGLWAAGGNNDKIIKV